MQLLPVVAGAIVPHAPLLLPKLESPEVAASSVNIRAAIASLSFDVDAIVILTPHARGPGVYAEISGDLSGFGVPGIEGKTGTDESVARHLDLPTIDGPIDHGVLVPLLLGKWSAPIVGVGVEGALDLRLDVDGRIGVIASVNLSAGLSSRAPLTKVPGAVEGEADFVAALNESVGEAVTRLPRSCGGDVMAAFARIFEGRPARVLAHESPVGVGYLVAEVG